MIHKKGIYPILSIVLKLFLLMIFTGFQTVYASVCKMPIAIEADKVATDNHNTVYYRGNVKLTSGLLTLQGEELSIRESSLSAMVYHIKKATFFIGLKENSIRGNSDSVFFYAKECMFDFFGYVRLIKEGGIYEYSNVRYTLSDSKILPLTMLIDQGVDLKPRP